MMHGTGCTSQVAVVNHGLGEGFVHLLVERQPHRHDGGLVLRGVQMHLQAQSVRGVQP